ncbi:MAG TPA: S1 RNA-binding domain-containing protein, partial [Planctomycetota bacterium]|nr:S1 RNA-binding domain-containing protein [Planctomycetota bacterium]
REDVRWLGDLKPGMELEAVVRRIAAYGVFVDLGITQEGLVHVSELADRFVKDPGEVVRIGERVKVRVLEVEPAKRKISLTMRSEEARKKAEEEREARRAARQRVRERRRRAVETAAAAPPAADGSAAPAIVPEGAPVEGAPPGDRPRRPSRFRDRPERRPMPVTRAASTRRDGLVGGRGRRNDFGPRRGGGKGDRRRDDEFVDDAGDAKGKAPQKREAPPQNAFAKFFQSHGLAEADRPAEAEAVAPAKPDEA